MSDVARRRELLEDAYRAALAAVDPEAATAAALAELDPPAPVSLCALGKAAPAMARAAAEVLGDGVTEAVVVSDHPEPLPEGYRLVVGSHPLPDRRSVQAGTALLETAVEAHPAGTLVVLVSGGGSALAEAPVRGVDVEDLAEVNRALMAAGVPIEEVNTVRRHLSLVKDAGLVRATSAPVVTLLISDVVDGPASAIASGPTLSDGSTPADALEVLRRHGLVGRVPAPVIAALEDAEPRPPPQVHHRHRVVADGATAARAAANHLASLGVDAEVVTTTLRGDAASEATHLVTETPPGRVAVAAGETTVQVTGEGTGGRNQHAALAGALAIEGTSTVFAALGTDGRDGPTDAAGAIVDGGTADRIRSADLDPEAFLTACDSHPALDAAGDLVRTGPTGTNVGDLWLAWRS